MKYEFNFTWNDVLRDAGLDVSEEKITNMIGFGIKKMVEILQYVNIDL